MKMNDFSFVLSLTGSMFARRYSEREHISISREPDFTFGWIPVFSIACFLIFTWGNGIF